MNLNDELKSNLNIIVKKGLLWKLDYAQKVEFLNLCSINYFFYDPFKNSFINPISLKEYKIKYLEDIYLESKTSFAEIIDFDFFKNDLENTKSRKPIENITGLVKKVNYTKNFIAILNTSLIIGLGISLFINLNLSPIIGFYFLYINYILNDNINYYKKIDSKEKIIKSKIISNLIYLILFYFTYKYYGTFWILLIIFSVHKLILNLLTPIINSIFYQGDFFFKQFKDEFEDDKTNKCRLKNSDETLCIHTDVEELKILIDFGVEEEKIEYNLFLFSNEPYYREQILDLIKSKKFFYEMKLFKDNEFSEFFYKKISNLNENIFIIVSKPEHIYFDLYHFEGDYSLNKLVSYHDNGEVEEYKEYKYGVKNGTFIEYFENGVIHFKCIFENGFVVPDYFVWYHDNGGIMLKGALRELKFQKPLMPDFYDKYSEFRIGSWEFFDKDGVLIKSVDYKENGEKLITYETENKENVPIWL